MTTRVVIIMVASKSQTVCTAMNFIVLKCSNIFVAGNESRDKTHQNIMFLY